MSALEKLKEKLRAKPNVEELGRKQVNVVIPIPNRPEEVRLTMVTINDKRETANFDIEELNKKLREQRLSKLIVAPTVEVGADSRNESGPIPLVTVAKPKPTKRLTNKTRLVLQDEGVAIIPQELPIVGEEQPIAREREEEDVATRPRQTRKLPKGVSILPPEAWIQFGDTPLLSRLPPKQPKVNYKVSSYYMNNREIFVNFINSVFEGYRDQTLDETSQITCDDLGKSVGDFKPLPHQLLVRDYLNLYTPYRGLLLFHSLGSGKTASSIAIAEGMKGAKKVIIMTPASLEDNYRLELKNAGDPLYRLNQCWEWVSIRKNPELAETLSSILSLPLEYIRKNGGAWLVNVTKPSNCDNGKSKTSVQQQKDQISINAQIDKMIETKYEFIHYNGLRRDKLKRMTDNFENNIFDDSVVVIDEAHNLISRIVNKLEKEKAIPMNEKGKKEKVHISLSLILYEMLLTAKNVRIVLLTGTPIINYPNEVAILYNILRGYIKTWEFPLDIRASQGVNKDSLLGIFSREKNLDYLDYNSSTKQLLITRNPFGFENKEKTESGYHGVTNEQRTIRKEGGEFTLQERGTISDDDFEKRIIHILRDNGIEVFASAIRVQMYKALPDKLEEFFNWFLESNTMNVKNANLFKRRIMGLTSYFRSAQESLLPSYEKISDYHIVKIPMSNYQFGVYEEARKPERRQDTSKKQTKRKVDDDGVFIDAVSTYRIFSRLFCNYVMPKEIGRPLPQEDHEVHAAEEGKEKTSANASTEAKAIEENYANALNKEDEVSKEDDDSREGEIEGDEIVERFANATYEKRLRAAMANLKEHASEYLSKSGLATYGPKYLHILENIQDPAHIGLHLVYSQFRTLEGIGIFTLVLEANGFAQFKLKKDGAGVWQIDIPPQDAGKPTFALYTGTESKEEKELVRKIYNSQWDELPPSLTAQLREIANNNNIGHVIKVFMITASGSEGINLRNTRYVHLMEPYWHPVRTEQVIGRARRICSHKALPQELQTVEVFLYLMTFTKEQLLSDESIELKLKDLSKREYQLDPSNPKKSYIPFTSDEALFEISSIKEEVTNQLVKAVKESSIDCAIYSKLGNKEQLHCLQFGDPSPQSFSYSPSLSTDNVDTMAVLNEKKLTWSGREVTLLGKLYIYRKVDKNRGLVYDLDSYKQALAVPGIEPTLLGTLNRQPNGEMKFDKI
jgi:hypothetical protein